MDRRRLAWLLAAGVLVVAALYLGSRLIPPSTPPAVACHGIDPDVCEQVWHDFATAREAPGLAGVTRVSVQVGRPIPDLCYAIDVEWWNGLRRLTTC